MTICKKAENEFSEGMTIKEYYAEIIELSSQFMAMHGFKRSGRSEIFYKYSMYNNILFYSMFYLLGVVFCIIFCEYAENL